MGFPVEKMPFNIKHGLFENQSSYYDFPIIQKQNIEINGSEKMIPFHEARNGKPDNKNNIVHFFIYDYFFEKVWNNPTKYLNLFKQFKAIIAPDFSSYEEWPKALQIYNFYRRCWLTAFYQKNGINVIATTCWHNKFDFDFWCSGIEPGCILAFPVFGVGNKDIIKSYVDGILEIKKRISPPKILFYGPENNILKDIGNVFFYQSFSVFMVARRKLNKGGGLHGKKRIGGPEILREGESQTEEKNAFMDEKEKEKIINLPRFKLNVNQEEKNI